MAVELERGSKTEFTAYAKFKKSDEPEKMSSDSCYKGITSLKAYIHVRRTNKQKKWIKDMNRNSKKYTQVALKLLRKYAQPD